MTEITPEKVAEQQTITDLLQCSYLYGQPKSTGLLRQTMSDFKVFEQLPFQASGEGEHLFLYIRKTGANTGFVAKQLAQYFSVKDTLVSYAGLKDRFAVTEQWFSVHLPGQKINSLADLAIEGVELLHYTWHNKKLRIGALSGNRFELTLRDVTDIAELERRWQVICHHGVPNYFGEQRFGINGGNLLQAKQMFAGKKVKDKKKRGMYLSAARSLIFNKIVSQRIDDEKFNEICEGDVLMLSGTQSVFLPEQYDDKIHQRYHEHDLDITAPLWGKGSLMTTGTINHFEEKLAQQYHEYAQGLIPFGLKQERRRIRLLISHAKLAVNDNKVILSFNLSAGAYATTVLRELLNYTDLTQRVMVNS